MSEETPTKRPLEETEGAEKAEEKEADASSTEPVAKKAKVEDGAKAEGEDGGKEAETAGGTGQADEKPATEASAAVEPPKAALAPPAADTSGLPEVLNTRPATKAKLEWLFTTGKVTQAEMDQKIISSLCEFPDATGVQIVELFAEADMSSIRGNKCGYLAGVMKRFRSDARMFDPARRGSIPSRANIELNKTISACRRAGEVCSCIEAGEEAASSPSSHTPTRCWPRPASCTPSPGRRRPARLSGYSVGSSTHTRGLQYPRAARALSPSRPPPPGPPPLQISFSCARF